MDSANQPKALRVLFFAEMWERFSYYGMRGLLVYYMTKHFRFSDDAAYVVYGAYTALVYTTPVIGGLLADRMLGGRKAVLFGGMLMALGHFAMAFDKLFYLALALLICGNGYFKPNISATVGRVYSDDDHKRDRAFAIFYMGINLGGMLSGVCGSLGEAYGWHVGFGLAGVGMIFGLCVFWWGQRYIMSAAEPPDPAKLRAPWLLGLSREWVIYLGTLAAVALSWYLVQQGALLGYSLLAVGLLTLAGLVYYLIAKTEPAERGPMLVALVLIIFSAVFWSFFEQAGSSMALFADRNVDRAVLGTTIKASVFSSSVNPIFVLLLSPLFIWLWSKLGRFEPSTPLKFALGTLQLGLGFGALWFGATQSRATGIVPMAWLLLGIGLHTTGELCLSPVGLSMITKLSPKRIVGMMMGAWFLASAEAQYIASVIARLTNVQGAEKAAGAVPATQTVMVYGSVFGGIAVTALVIGCGMVAVSPWLARRMGAVR